MDKAKFYKSISQYFIKLDVSSVACGAPSGQIISGTGVPDYILLCISQVVGNKEVSLWFSNVDSDNPHVEIRIGEIVTNNTGQSDLQFLLTFPFSEFLMSFNLKEDEALVKQKLQMASGQMTPQVISVIDSMIDGAINDFKNL